MMMIHGNLHDGGDNSSEESVNDDQEYDVGGALLPLIISLPLSFIVSFKSPQPPKEQLSANIKKLQIDSSSGSGTIGLRRWLGAISILPSLSVSRNSMESSPSLNLLIQELSQGQMKENQSFTILKILAGVVSPTSGTVFVEKPKNFVFQNSKKRRREASPVVESSIKATPVAGNPLQISFVFKKPKEAKVFVPHVPLDDGGCSTSGTEVSASVSGHEENLPSTSLEGYKTVVPCESKKKKKHKTSK